MVRGSCARFAFGAQLGVHLRCGLNLAAQRLKEPLALTNWQAIARTFVKNTQGSNFKHDIGGKDEAAPYVANSRCEGWLALVHHLAFRVVLCPPKV
jgi:hypothetical protein